MPNAPLTFVVFTGDLVTFGIKRILQVDWKFPPQTSAHRRTFHETVGVAALVFRHRHADEFAEKIADFPTFIAEDAESAVDYLEHFTGTHFKGRVPLMELLVYCAFLVDLCVCCVENGRTDLLDDIIPENYDVYDDHVRSYFEVVGGWLALLSVARDYLAFVESMLVYSDLVAAYSKNDVAIPSDNKDERAIHIESLRDIEDKDVNLITDTGSEGTGLACNNTDSLGNKDSKAIPKTTNFDSDFIRATAGEASRTDSEDLMSISSTETRN